MRISDWSSDVCSSDLDPNASIPTPQPVHARPMFASYGRAIGASCISFVSAAAIEDGIVERLRLDRMVLPVRNTRGIGKAEMKLNDALPDTEADPENYEGRADGELHV